MREHMNREQNAVPVRRMESFHNCAQSLVAHGFGKRVDIYDQGSRGPGGRTSSSRPAEINGETMVFDHGAQFFTATNAKFKVRARSHSTPQP